VIILSNNNWSREDVVQSLTHARRVKSPNIELSMPSSTESNRIEVVRWVEEEGHSGLAESDRVLVIL
jgi:hypothetical protein